MRFLATLFGVFSIATAASAAYSVHLPIPQVETLPNGLQVVWFLSDRLPIVDVSLFVKSGYRDDVSGKSGTAALVAETLDRSAGGMTAVELSQAIEQLGASRGSSTDEDTFTVGMHGLSVDAVRLLELLSKITLKPEFPVAEVDREHARMLDRWNHIGDSGETLANLAVQRVLTSGTSYGRGAFYSAAEFKKVGHEDVVKYYQTHFVPKNSILMVVGNVNREIYRQKIAEFFGAWRGEAPARAYRDYQDSRITRQKGQIFVVDRPGLNQAQVRFGLRAPSVHAPEHYALAVANALLGEYFNSRLMSVVRDKLGLTYSIGSSFSYSKDISFFGIGSATKNESVSQLVRKTTEILKDLKLTAVPVSEDFQNEVRMAKEYLVGGFPLSTSTLGSVASRWLAGTLYDLGPDFLNSFVPKINAVEPKDVAAAARRFIDLDQLVVVIAGDAGEIEKNLMGAFGFKKSQIKRLRVQDLM